MPKKEAYYFSHDSNARNDPKLLKLRVKLKMEGYGVYWCLVEMLRDQTDFMLPLDYEAISFGLNVSPDLVEKVINEFSLFVVESGFFHSESLIRRMSERKEKSLKASESAKKRWEKSQEIKPELPKEPPKINPSNKLDFDQIKLNFQSQRGLSKPFFVRMQDLHSLPETEIITQFDNWKLKNESNAFTIKHAENSFNIWIGNYKENKNGTSKAGKQSKQNGSKQLGSIYEKISGIHRE